MAYKDKNKAAEYHKKYQSTHPDYVKNLHTTYRYGITVHQYKKMHEQQNNKCAICEETCDKLHIDHDHATGKVRQLLCSYCNRGLGNFRETPSLLQKAVEYLTKWKQF